MALEKFHFEQDGNEYTIPRINQVPMGIIRKTKNIEDKMDQAFTILVMLLGEGSPEMDALDAMTAEEFNEFLEGWTSNENFQKS
jgi:hypothetical protein